jgi:hypothetical protein
MSHVDYPVTGTSDAYNSAMAVQSALIECRAVESGQAYNVTQRGARTGGSYLPNIFFLFSAPFGNNVDYRPPSPAFVHDLFHRWLSRSGLSNPSRYEAQEDPIDPSPSCAVMAFHKKEASLPVNSFGDQSRKALDKIEGFGRLEAGWAGEGTVPPSEPTCNAAASLVRNLSERWPAPQVTLSVDGEIGLTWHKAGNRVEVLIDQDIYVVSLGKFDNEYVDGDEVEWGSEAPPGLLQLLGRLYL